MIRCFKPTKKKAFKPKRMFGFDIETYGDKNTFICCSVYGENFQKTYTSKEAFFDDFFIEASPFKDSIFFATQMGFDFLGTFEEHLSGFYWRLRGSDFIFAKTYIYNKQFNRFSRGSKERFLILDTMSYHRASVDQLGQIIGVKKLAKPCFLGQLPSSIEEWEIMKEYNLRDAEVSYRFMKLLYEKFAFLGITPEYTIAGTSMSFYKSHFLDDTYIQKDIEILDDMFLPYYGGRTETFKRGTFKNVRCYDINSLYPSVMINPYPNPNTMRKRIHGNIGYIENFEGFSYIECFCPPDVFPLLPLRIDNKLIFPTGHIKGYYCHNEIRKAIELGYIISKIGKQYYFMETCRPFDGFVKFLYEERKKTDKKDFMNIVYKILLNSLYGKFAQEYRDKSSWHYNNFSAEELRKFTNVEIKGEYIRITEDREPSSFCIPIWSAYVTAYGRIKLYSYLERLDPIACDTDSIFTLKEIPESRELGYMKFEGLAEHSIFVRPKFYCFGDKIVLKGCPIHLNKSQFIGIMQGKPIKSFKFLKLAEAIRRDMGFNEKVELIKEFRLEDEKRDWGELSFNYAKPQLSKPLHITEDGKIFKEINIFKKYEEETHVSF